MNIINPRPDDKDPIVVDFSPGCIGVVAREQQTVHNKSVTEYFLLTETQHSALITPPSMRTVRCMSRQ